MLEINPTGNSVLEPVSLRGLALFLGPTLVFVVTGVGSLGLWLILIPKSLELI